MTLRTLDSLGNLRGKKVLVRCDFNVPLADNIITDDGRIRASLPTIARLRESGAKVIVLSHLGRPEGAPDERFSLGPAARRLGELLDTKVVLATDTVGASAHESVSQMSNGDVVVLENVRFNPEETSKDDGERSSFAALLAALGDAYVSDGFGVVHRKQASVFELARALPSAAGLLIETELRVLERLTSSPERPYTVVLGGSKVSDKLGVISHLLPRVDTILIGGGMLYTFLAAQGFAVGSSLLEGDQLMPSTSWFPPTGLSQRLLAPLGLAWTLDQQQRRHSLNTLPRRRPFSGTGPQVSLRCPRLPTARDGSHRPWRI
jgi:phosphoglycerate kinase